MLLSLLQPPLLCVLLSMLHPLLLKRKQRPMVLRLEPDMPLLVLGMQRLCAPPHLHRIRRTRPGTTRVKRPKRRPRVQLHLRSR